MFVFTEFMNILADKTYLSIYEPYKDCKIIEW